MGEASDLLSPGERVLWQGHRAGYPFSIWVALVYVVLLLAGAGPFCISIDPLTKITAVKHGFATVTLTEDSLGNGILTTTYPSPFLLLAFVLLDAWRTARWHARRFLITDRRVLATDGQGRLAGEIPIAELDEACVDLRDLVISGRGKLLRLESTTELERALSLLRTEPDR